MFDLPSQQLSHDVTRGTAFRAGYMWALADAGALIHSQIQHCETADERNCLLAVMNALREMGLHC